MFFACTQNAGHVTGIIFGIVDNPYQAGVLGKIGPYLPCSTLSSKKPPLGIAMAAGFVQSSCLEVSDILPPFRSSASYFPAQKAVFGRPCNESGRADRPAGRRRQGVK